VCFGSNLNISVEPAVCKVNSEALVTVYIETVVTFYQGTLRRVSNYSFVYRGENVRADACTLMWLGGSTKEKTLNDKSAEK
jgi:hypothetical protein